MKVEEAPTNIKEICSSFVENFYDDSAESISQKYFHDNTWKETDEELAKITLEILDSLNDIWKNPAFGIQFQFAESQSEGIYVTDVISPLLQASLKKLPIKNFAFLSSAEQQSLASENRRGDGKGKRPDMMLMEENKGKLYELMFVECSCLVCVEHKKKEDKTKLWREMNDGLDWVYKGCKPD
ncbi:hypothetical protein F8M41_023115 [Gigaspora margarita]|uniref:Uncharacterized protein n=1 Tax=Gigaspora margarita TaxID=4874 RepID=A0A8H4ADZ8_GIGMA|nr:hypothetical protein F8M41_023115 [Gigaspora margarita]